MPISLGQVGSSEHVSQIFCTARTGEFGSWFKVHLEIFLSNESRHWQHRLDTFHDVTFVSLTPGAAFIQNTSKYHYGRIVSRMLVLAKCQALTRVLILVCFSFCKLNNTCPKSFHASPTRAGIVTHYKKQTFQRRIKQADAFLHST